VIIRGGLFKCDKGFEFQSSPWRRLCAAINPAAAAVACPGDPQRGPGRCGGAGSRRESPDPLKVWLLSGFVYRSHVGSEPRRSRSDEAHLGVRPVDAARERVSGVRRHDACAETTGKREFQPAALASRGNE